MNTKDISLKMVLWDHDGVVSNTVPFINTLRKTFYQKNYNTEVPSKICAGVNFPQEYDFLKNNEAFSQRFSSLSELEGCYKDLQKELQKNTNIEMISGVEGVLDYLNNKGVKNVIVSNADHEHISNCLGLKTEMFDGIFTSEDVKLPKPNPEMLCKAMDSFGISSEECLFVDDTAHGAKAGLNAGVETVLFTSNPEEIAKAEEASIERHFSQMPCLQTFLKGKIR